ncbi:putative protein [Aquifex aeolicus VF5]|uniref:Twin-arginine translocation signal domain-containing protein n=2 Tax=Aquifex aeolicus TaxID=63363 RepID=O67143_AQUAE|nr:putative protein [Aquifex aeolicus VF5]
MNFFRIKRLLTMDRRDFLKGASALGLSFTLSSFSFSSRKVTFSYDVDLPYKGEACPWLPVPINTDYQRVLDLRFEGTYRRAGIYRDKVYGSPTLYAEFPRGESKKVLKLEVSVEFSPRRVSLVD